MTNLTTVILAAGLGKRMKSDLPKALQKVSGRPMIKHVIDLAKKVHRGRVVCVLGHGREQIIEEIGAENIIKNPEITGMHRGVYIAVQEQQLGTGHAARCAEDLFGSDDGDVVILFGDTPLITESTLESFVSVHDMGFHQASLISFIADDPSGFGRIIRDEKGRFVKIVEEKDASPKERQIKEVNSGVGIFKTGTLKKMLAELDSDNAQNEYMLTDVFEKVIAAGGTIGVHTAKDPSEMMGVNDKYALQTAEEIHQKRIKKDLMEAGVTFRLPETTMVDPSARIKPGAVIEQGCRIMGYTTIESDAEIGPNSEIIDSTIGPRTVVRQSVIESSYIDEDCNIGPFAYIRPGSNVDDGCRIGNFVEVKNSQISTGTKISHLSYIGDADLGENVNIGAGTVVVNYDGKQKHKSSIGSKTFVGCNSSIVSPVNIGEGCFIAAGSTITEDMDDNMFAKSRTAQQTVPNKFKE